MTNIDPADMTELREWAKAISKLDPPPMSIVTAAARLISSLPDTIVDGDKLREITRNVEAATPGFPTEYQGKLRTLVRSLNTLLPAPAPRPEDVPDGYWLIRWWGEEKPVPAEKVEGQWWVIGRTTMLHAKDITLVSRLVPEVKA